MRKDDLLIMAAGLAVVLIIALLIQEPGLSISGIRDTEPSIPAPDEPFPDTPPPPVEPPFAPDLPDVLQPDPPDGVTIVVRQHTVVDPDPHPDIPSSIRTRATDTAATYRWYYKDSYYTWTIHIPADQYNYFATLPRDKPHPADYVMSDRGRTELEQIVSDMIDLANAQNLNEDERRDMVIAFVQSLPQNRGGTVRTYDAYPRYPLQTLYDGGGDSQDTAILLTALLRLLGIQASLLETPKHYAVVIPLTEQQKDQNPVYLYKRGDSQILKGAYLDDQNRIRDFYSGDTGVVRNSYIYIESNIPGYPIGTIPPQLRGFFVRSLREKYYVPEAVIDGAAIHEPLRNPDADFTFNARLIHIDHRYAYYQVYCSISSTGTGTARDVKVDITARPADNDGSWVFEETIAAMPIPEGEARIVQGTLQVPRNEAAIIECRLRGSGIAEKKKESEVFFT